uniref:Winged helix-turn-helix transcriptional regulator n=1 Tax=Thermodesulfobacterium geofontis TaxID=1295609 RepID=A0A7V4JR12_9BACT
MPAGCISPDGKLSERAIEFLKLLNEKGKISASEVAELTKRPLFQVRNSLRELTEAGFIALEGEEYSLTEKGRSTLL